MRHFLSIMPSLLVKHHLIVGEGWGPSARRRNPPDASGRLTSFNVEGRGSRALPQSSWCVHRWIGRSMFSGRHFNGKQPSNLNEISLNISTAGWVFFWGGLCTGLKFSARLCTKNGGGGGIFARHWYALHKVKRSDESPLISCSLTFCSLSGNKISDEGARVLGEALRVNQSLQKLKWVQSILSYF